MAVFPTTEVDMLLDATFGVADYAVTVASPTLRLNTSAGSDAAAGTQVTGGGYTPQVTPFLRAGAPARGISNTELESFTLMPVATVTHIEIYNGAGSARKAYGALTASKTTASGDTLSFAIGAIDVVYG